MELFRAERHLMSVYWKSYIELLQTIEHFIKLEGKQINARMS